MTSGAALDEPSVRNKSQEGGCCMQARWALEDEGVSRLQAVPDCSENSNKWILNGKKRQQISTVTICTPKTKKVRTAVQRTHSPKTTIPIVPLPGLSRVEKATATVSGIEEVARHLLHTKSRCNGSPGGGSHAILAMPTECTYEACSLLKWCKEETNIDGNNKSREEQLDRLRTVSSTSSVHVYLQHHNIAQMDQLLDFPKKAYAIKQNPKKCFAFNESRLLFQKLADQFWPGPVHLYLTPQSFAPDGLIQSSFSGRQFVGFRCPSHPLAVKVLKHVHQKSREPAVLIGAPIVHNGTKVLRARDVANKFLQSPELCSDSRIQILHGEERREIFTVPTCQFQDEWLECWLVPDKRTIVLRGKSKRDVIPQLKEVLRSSTNNNRVVCSVLQHWKVADHREK